MIIGTPKEVKANKTRVAMTPCWAVRHLQMKGYCYCMPDMPSLCPKTTVALYWIKNIQMINIGS